MSKFQKALNSSINNALETAKDSYELANSKALLYKLDADCKKAYKTVVTDIKLLAQKFAIAFIGNKDGVQYGKSEWWNLFNAVKVAMKSVSFSKDYTYTKWNKELVPLRKALCDATAKTKPAYTKQSSKLLRSLVGKFAWELRKIDVEMTKTLIADYKEACSSTAPTKRGLTANQKRKIDTILSELNGHVKPSTIIILMDNKVSKELVEEYLASK